MKCVGFFCISAWLYSWSAGMWRLCVSSVEIFFLFFFFFSSRRRHTRFDCDWSSDVCSSDLIVLASVHGSQAISVVDSMKPAAPTNAASGSSASPRRNQYVASPAAISLSSAGTVSAHVGGSAHASHVSGNTQAVCGFEKKGAPAYAYGVQSGRAPGRASGGGPRVHGWKACGAAPGGWVGPTGPG